MSTATSFGSFLDAFWAARETPRRKEHHLAERADRSVSGTGSRAECRSLLSLLARLPKDLYEIENSYVTVSDLLRRSPLDVLEFSDCLETLMEQGLVVMTKDEELGQDMVAVTAEGKLALDRWKPDEPRDRKRPAEAAGEEPPGATRRALTRPVRH
jgi:predicted transcriptional regulator